VVQLLIQLDLTAEDGLFEDKRVFFLDPEQDLELVAVTNIFPVSY